jgi:hypothetical protein
LVGCAASKHDAATSDASASEAMTLPATPPHPMPNAPGLGLPHPQSYDTASHAGVVVDLVTGVAWQRELEASAGRSWPDAKAYCESLALGGHDDWRLPTRLELVSIIDASQFDPAIDRAAFPNTPAFGFWSGSLHADQPETAWLVYSKEGYTSFNQFAYGSQARCVRSDVSPSSAATAPHLVVGGDGTVLDTDTGLVWKQNSEPMRYTFEGAQAACQALAFAGHDDWRVPTVTELQTLVDETVVPPEDPDSGSSGRIDVAAFPDAPGEPYWTSSAYAGDPALAWFVDFRPGYTFGYDRAMPYLVRCVR